MFTGIIEEIGSLQRMEIRGAKRYFTIGCEVVNRDVKLGDSICCDGVCLTVIRFDDRGITVEAMRETLEKTTANDWRSGRAINLERAMPADGRFGGHIVQGHIDCRVSVLSHEKRRDTNYLEIALPKDNSLLVVAQGSIAINGVSLTIARLSESSLTVALIGHTLEMTNLRLLTTGDAVNVEYDIIGKYILRQQDKQRFKITEEWLVEKGF